METKKISAKKSTLSINVPKNWADRTMHIYVDKENEDHLTSVVIQTEAIDARTSLEQYADIQLCNLAKDLPEFQIVKREKISIQEKEAMKILYTWGTQGKTYKQQQVFAICPKKQCVFSLVASSLQDKFSQVESVFDQIIASIRLESN